QLVAGERQRLLVAIRGTEFANEPGEDRAPNEMGAGADEAKIAPEFLPRGPVGGVDPDLHVDACRAIAERSDAEPPGHFHVTGLAERGEGLGAIDMNEWDVDVPDLSNGAEHHFGARLLG